MAIKSGRSVTITDVAKKAGVSVATVSRVLNGSSLVKPETGKEIAAVAEEMGYRLASRRPGPKPGRPVRKKKVAFINFLDRYHLGSEFSSTFVALEKGINQGAKENGLAVHLQLICTENELTEQLREGGYGGCLLLGMCPHPTVEEFLKTQPCCWVMNNPWTPTWGDHVMPDHREVGMMAAEYLIRRRCRKPVFIKLGLADRVSALREEGFFYAAGKLKTPGFSLVAKRDDAEHGASYPDAAYVDEIIQRFKTTVGEADGISFDSDHSLATLYPVMVREKMITPGKTVLIGCNNQQPFLKGIKPHPATMEVHFEQIGRMGVAQLVWRMKNRDCQRIRSLVAPKLIALI